MGYNPLRKYRGSRAMDIGILLVITALVVSLVIWATAA
jgi:hypothetical protein